MGLWLILPSFFLRILRLFAANYSFIFVFFVPFVVNLKPSLFISFFYILALLVYPVGSENRTGACLTGACFVSFILAFFREAMTIFVRRCLPDKCPCESVWICG